VVALDTVDLRPGEIGESPVEADEAGAVEKAVYGDVFLWS